MKKDRNGYYKGAAKYNDTVVRRRVGQQLEMVKSVIVKKNSAILEVGAYGGLLLQALYAARYNNLFVCDIFDSKDTVKVLAKFSIEDITKKTGFRSNTFDLLIASHVIEHVYDVGGMLSEIKRIVKKDGYILLSIPLDLHIVSRFKILLSGRISDPFNTGGHIKFYNPEDLENKLKQNKFKIISEIYSGLGYGRLDTTKLGFLTKRLATYSPELFGGEVHYLLRNKK